MNSQPIGLAAIHHVDRYRALYDGSPVPIFVWKKEDDDFVFVDCNSAADDLMHQKVREMLGVKASELLASTTPELLRGMHRCFNEQQTIKHLTFRRFQSTGELKHLSVSFVYVPADHVLIYVVDISEQMIVEVAWREAERKYKDIFENVTEGVFQSTPNGTYLTANPAMARMLGFDSPEELIAVRQDIGRQQYVDETKRDEFKRLLAEHDVVRGFEYEAYTKDGNKIWISDNVRAVRDESGSVNYYEGTANDITQRKAAQQALSESETRLRAIFEKAPMGISVMESETGRFLKVNPRYSEITGYSEAELLELTFHDITHPEDAGIGMQYLQSFLANKSPSFQFEKRYVRKDGSIVWVSVTSVRLWDEVSKQQQHMALVEDINERRRTAEALRDSEERYRELFENSRDAIYVHDVSGRYTSVNAAAEKLSGYSREEILGRSFSDFISPKDLMLVRENLCRKLSEQGETAYEIEIRTKDGRSVPVEVSSRLVHQNGVPVAIQGTARDITERKRAQEALQQFSRRLISAQELERQRIARELHDEIGQALTAVRLNLQAIQDFCRTANCVPYLGDNLRVVDDALRLVKDLSLDLRPSVLDDLGLRAAVQWYVSRHAERCGLVSEFQCDSMGPEKRLPRDVETNAFRILQEALTNVARHSQANRVLVELRRVNGDLILAVSDDGIGFDYPSHAYSTLASTLGLRGMQERAVALNGKLEIHSVGNQGTTVRAFIPIPLDY